MRKRGADGQRSDHDAERCASAVEAIGSDLQAGRIYAGERDAGQCQSTMIADGAGQAG
jgi:hypothetical protein